MVVLGVALSASALSAPMASGIAVGTGKIEGEVTGPGAGPLAEVWVCAYFVDSEEFEEDCDFTDAGGTYAIKGLKAGHYKVEFWSEVTEPSYAGEYYNDKSFWEEADEVEVEEGVATTGINAELAEGATIEGEVRAALLGGHVGSADALVCVTLSTGEPGNCALTQADGTYVLPGLPAGEYKIQFLASSSYNLLDQFYDHKADYAEAETLVVAAGETKTGVDADLEAGAEIHGTVYSAATGAPLSKVRACAFFFEPVFEEWLLRECVLSSSGGQYELRALWSNDFKVAFSVDFNEVFGEGPHEEDGYFAQYFDGKPTLAAADPLPLTPPQVMTGVDAHLQPKHVPAALVTPSIPPVIATPKRHRKVGLHCRPGFRKKKVSGRRRCVKIHKHRRHRRGHRKSA